MRTSSSVYITPTPGTRYDLVDALRGFAIMGILLLHSIEHFNYYVFPDNANLPAWMVGVNARIWGTMFFLFGSKAYGIFALLFGFTFHLQFSRREAQGMDFGPVFLWRMVLLFGFGWINCILFPGEVLLLYAVLGPSLFFVRKLKDGALLAVAVVFLLQPFEVYQFLQSFFNPDYPRLNFHVDALWGQTFDYINSGSFLALVANWWVGFKATFLWSLDNGRIEQTIGLFMLGVFAGRRAWFENRPGALRRWLTVCVICTLVFALFQGFETLKLSGINAQYRWSMKILFQVWKNFFQLGMMVSIFCSLHAAGWFRWLVSPLRNYGRMSLSNYMMQSIVGGFIFYPYALGLADDIPTLYSLLLGVGLFFVYLTFCNLWFTKLRFKQGPCEMLWHYLTWLPLKLRRRRHQVEVAA